MGKHALTDNYRQERADLLQLGRSLSDEQAAQITSACPAWSIKDVYAHLAGISTDILAGNTEGAATEAWADGHVADRLGHSFSDVLDEWETSGDGVSAVMAEAGEAFPFQLFVDQWTHGWDVRSSLGESAAARPDLAVYEYFLDDFMAAIQSQAAKDMSALTLRVNDKQCELGTGPSVGELTLDLFEFARISMGRRSQAQLDALAWPPSVTDHSRYIDALVFWSVNDNDVVDPVLT